MSDDITEIELQRVYDLIDEIPFDEIEGDFHLENVTHTSTTTDNPLPMCTTDDDKPMQETLSNKNWDDEIINDVKREVEEYPKENIPFWKITSTLDTTESPLNGTWNQETTNCTLFDNHSDLTVDHTTQFSDTGNTNTDVSANLRCNGTTTNSELINIIDDLNGSTSAVDNETPQLTAALPISQDTKTKSEFQTFYDALFNTEISQFEEFLCSENNKINNKPAESYSNNSVTEKNFGSFTEEYITDLDVGYNTIQYAEGFHPDANSVGDNQIENENITGKSLDDFVEGCAHVAVENNTIKYPEELNTDYKSTECEGIGKLNTAPSTPMEESESEINWESGSQIGLASAFSKPDRNQRIIVMKFENMPEVRAENKVKRNYSGRRRYVNIGMSHIMAKNAPKEHILKENNNPSQPLRKRGRPKINRDTPTANLENADPNLHQMQVEVNVSHERNINELVDDEGAPMDFSVTTNTEIENINPDTESYPNVSSIKRGRGRPKGAKTKHSSDMIRTELFQCFTDTVCNICNTYYPSMVDLINHGCKSHFNEVLNTYQCVFCNQSQRNIEDIVEHIQCHNSEMNINIRILFDCTLCENIVRFTSTADLLVHIQENHKLTANDDSGKNGCLLCTKQILGLNEFVEHILLDHPSRNASSAMLCPICGDREYYQESELTNHIVDVHSESSQYTVKCSVCGEIKGNNDIVGHIIANHSNLDFKEKPKYYRCVACLSGFSTLTKLTKHVCPKLEGVNCPECQIVFPSKKRLAFHMQFHQNVDFPLQCDVCFKTFDNEHKCYNHVRFQHELELYPCVYCNETFKSRVGLIIHQQYHTGSRNYECGICGKRFYNNTTLKEHEVSHMSVKPYKCNICGTFLSRASRLRVHLKAHSVAENTNTQCCYNCVHCDLVSPSEEGISKHICLPPEAGEEIKPKYELIILSKTYLCDFCGECFKNSDSLHKHRHMLHLDLKLGADDLAYSCKTCGMQFKTYSRLTTHRLTHGINTESFIVPKAVYDEDIKTESFIIPQLFSCEHCPKLYYQYTAYNYHRKYAKHKNKDNLCRNKKFENKTDVKNMYQCYVCKKLFVSPKSAESHYKKYHSPDCMNERFICCYCGKNYTSKHSLILHERVHSDVEDSYCSICGKTFKHIAAFYSHMRRHTAPKDKYACETCDKTFRHPGDKINHERIHTGERPYECEKCGEKMISRQAWIKHTKTHETKTDEVYKCVVCDKKFDCSSAFYAHECGQKSKCRNGVEVHTEEPQYQYEQCDNGMSSRQTLDRRHMNNDKLHTETAYKCVFCNEQFACSFTFQSHECGQKSECRNRERIRTEECLYECEQCGKGMMSRQTFNLHMKEHKRHTEEAYYKCVICDEKFACPSAFHSHECVQKNKCLVCDKTFKTEKQLANHQKCHLKENFGQYSHNSQKLKIECHTCGRKYSSVVWFNKHSEKCLQGTSGKTYCSVCLMEFKSNRSLETHMKVSHGTSLPFSFNF